MPISEIRSPILARMSRPGKSFTSIPAAAEHIVKKFISGTIGGHRLIAVNRLAPTGCEHVSGQVVWRVREARTVPEIGAEHLQNFQRQTGIAVDRGPAFNIRIIRGLHLPLNRPRLRARHALPQPRGKFPGCATRRLTTRTAATAHSRAVSCGCGVRGRARLSSGRGVSQIHFQD